MEKTAMREFLEDYNNFKVKPQTYYLELEKKQLIDFHEAGQSIFSDTTFTHEAKKHYTNKFNK